jgi:integrase
MKKKEKQRKEPIKIRQKELSNGNISLYLDIYWKGERKYEFLNLYLLEAKNTLDREQNKQTMLIAEQIRSQRLVDLQSGKYMLKQAKREFGFIEYFKQVKADRLNSKGNYGNWDAALKHLLTFTKQKELNISDIDETWLMRFKHFLLNEKLTKSCEKLSQNSAHSYFNKVKAALRQAFEQKYINENPASRIRGIKQAETRREFLTWEEVEEITKQACDTKKLKEAFLFSVMTGLRWSDIIKMKWSEVRGSNSAGWLIQFQQQKTKAYEVLPITQEARDLLGEEKELDERVFIGLKYSTKTNVALARWLAKAGITRYVTFHCARHTHATLLLSEGVDIYVVSKLLGHKTIKTTEIYAKVSNIKKQEAVNKLPKLNLSSISK